ncbi:XRE family transcriptional regulator [Paraburkholderia ginsengiterrae]|uniref:XRE family transcriptional regulator n=1 Tax=Paraburkholderia ginsengiterrae TaxID=1462993 RepID=A0A1A9NAF5_9BURK|nr:helix-turn-helix transcriptional regulator [Paraburkholderia ginsengiterrae]OAJ61484.1 XRE family transcriptional regulator [Paraburkholderia ginsengiterrae]OAJ62887.1 XRE family transcriptional regulator [Paraburkholderia ginsengiterrae]
MNTKDKQFFRDLGERIANARKAHGLTQQQLADTLGIAQQTMAHYEGGRSKLPVSMLPVLSQLLTLSFDELMGKPIAQRGSKHGRMSRLQQQLIAIERLPRTKQQFISKMLDTVLGQR